MRAKVTPNTVESSTLSVQWGVKKTSQIYNKTSYRSNIPAFIPKVYPPVFRFF